MSKFNLVSVLSGELPVSRNLQDILEQSACLKRTESAVYMILQMKCLVNMVVGGLEIA